MRENSQRFFLYVQILDRIIPNTGWGIMEKERTNATNKVDPYNAKMQLVEARAIRERKTLAQTLCGIRDICPPKLATILL